MRVTKYLLLVALLTVGGAAHGVVAETEAPFTLTWTKGRVSGNYFFDPDAFEFTTPEEGWATSTGNFRRIYHTSDGGKTWKEVPGTEIGGGDLYWSFLNKDRGWIALVDEYGPPYWMISTRDGGKHWQHQDRRTPPGQFVFFDENNGYAVSDLYFFATSNGGESWEKVAKLHTPGDQMIFLNRQIGWITEETKDQRFFVARTLDGGKHWSEVQLPIPVNHRRQSQPLFFLDQNVGWYAGSTTPPLFRTDDGGKTWHSESVPGVYPEPAYDNYIIESAVAFVSPEKGFLFARRLDAPPELRYTTDGGQHWTLYHEVLPYVVTRCQVLGGDVLCSAIGKRGSFPLLTVHPR